MSKFCQNCGTALADNANFCTKCGTPATQDAPQQPQRTVYAASAGIAPAQYAQNNGAKEQKSASRKKNNGGLIAVISILLVVLIGVICFFGFRDGGWFRRSSNENVKEKLPSRPTTYDAQSMQSLLDYAKQLEEAGNSEAAEAVYELIEQGGGAELIEKAHEEDSIIKAVDEIGQLQEIFGNVRGGNGE